MFIQFKRSFAIVLKANEKKNEQNDLNATELPDNKIGNCHRIIAANLSIK